jgi:uncharacterized membrane protein YphA (DoxX/SURF4 family)
MNITLWIIQGVLAAIFLMAGIMKATQSKEVLREKVGDWVDNMSMGTIKTIGLVEILGAIGLIAPMSLNVLPVLVPAAAIGLLLTMFGAIITHAKRKESKEMGMNFVFILLITFVIVGRTILLPTI